MTCHYDLKKHFKILLRTLQGKENCPVTKKQIEAIKNDILYNEPANRSPYEVQNRSPYEVQNRSPYEVQNRSPYEVQISSEFWNPRHVRRSLGRLHFPGQENVFNISQRLGWKNPFVFTEEEEENLQLKFNEIHSIFLEVMKDQFPDKINFLPVNYIIRKLIEISFDIKKYHLDYIIQPRFCGEKFILNEKIWEALMTKIDRDKSIYIKGSED